MKYMGSKNRIAKHLLPIMLAECENHGITTWVEPFVGGANMVDKVSESFERIGYDNNNYLIEMYKELQEYGIQRFNHHIPKDLYDKVRSFYNGKDLSFKYNDSYVGWVGFMASANGRFFDGGYSGVSKTKLGTSRNYIDESVRGLKKEIRLLISEEDYKKFFDSNEKTFANRWSEVLPEIKPALLK